MQLELFHLDATKEDLERELQKTRDSMRSMQRSMYAQLGSLKSEMEDLKHDHDVFKRMMCQYDMMGIENAR